MADNQVAFTLHTNNQRTDASGLDMQHGVQSVGQLTISLYHPYLKALYNKDTTAYKGLSAGSIDLTGFKLEDTVISTDTQLDNAKLVPMLNGDTMTLTNANKSGTITFAATRTSAGVAGGDIVAIADFIRSQGDSVGGELTIKWYMNGQLKEMKFYKVCVKKCPPLMYAGNDLPSYGVSFTFATYSDADFPTWKA